MSRRGIGTVAIGIVLLLAAVAGFIVVPEHKPGSVLVAPNGDRGPQACTHELVIDCHQVATGLSQRAYDVLRTETWALLVVGALLVAISRVRHSRQPVHVAAGATSASAGRPASLEAWLRSNTASATATSANLDSRSSRARWRHAGASSNPVAPSHHDAKVASLSVGDSEAGKVALKALIAEGAERLAAGQDLETRRKLWALARIARTL